MDQALLSYLKDKKQYIKDFANGRYIINPIIIGIILSYSQQDLGNDLSLLESLDKLIIDLHDHTHKAYCICKFFKSSNEYIKSAYEPSAKFIQIYYRISIHLSEFEISPSIKSSISNYFSLNFLVLMKNFSRTMDFMKIYKIGRKNPQFFSIVPEIFYLGIDDDLERISLVREETNLHGLIQALYCLCSKILGKRIAELSEISIYLAAIIKIIYNERINIEILNDFSKNLSQFGQIFNEEIRLELDGCHREALQRCGSYEINGLFRYIQLPPTVNAIKSNFTNPPQFAKPIQAPIRPNALPVKPAENPQQFSHPFPLRPLEVPNVYSVNPAEIPKQNVNPFPIKPAEMPPPLKKNQKAFSDNKIINSSQLPNSILSQGTFNAKSSQIRIPQRTYNSSEVPIQIDIQDNNPPSIINAFDTEMSGMLTDMIRGYKNI